MTWAHVSSAGRRGHARSLRRYSSDPVTGTTSTTDDDVVPSTDGAAPSEGSASSRRAALLARFRPQGTEEHRHLLTGSGLLVIGAGVQALGGMVFSLIVAQGDTKS